MPFFLGMFFASYLMSLTIIVGPPHEFYYVNCLFSLSFSSVSQDSWVFLFFILFPPTLFSGMSNQGLHHQHIWLLPAMWLPHLPFLSFFLWFLFCSKFVLSPKWLSAYSVLLICATIVCVHNLNWGIWDLLPSSLLLLFLVIRVLDTLQVHLTLTLCIGAVTTPVLHPDLSYFTPVQNLPRKIYLEVFLSFFCFIFEFHNSCHPSSS